MNYLFDTNICVALIRQKQPALLQKVTSFPPGEIGISTVSVAELFYGAAKSSQPERSATGLEQFLLPFEIVDFDYAASRTYGAIRAFLEKSGLPIGSMDMLIAAHALSLNITLVTNNTREFSRVPGLTLEDWLRP